MLGTLTILFSLVVLWSNERKLVKFTEFIAEAKKECRSIDTEQPKEEDDYWLVHGKGVVENSQDITDHAFGVSAANSYRLIRKVEMLQWCEKIESREINGKR